MVCPGWKLWRSRKTATRLWFGIFQYYSVADDELAKGYAGQYASAQETADTIATAWDKITDQIGRDSQIAVYKASLDL